ncbi:DUF2341 domain-containing protein [Thermococcus waiotapuensis]|uniref:DUF2341 domain-containing protein n=1 Tax=Thermococcus waiotapuensis TaxID=90909 RepID=A0AAE4NWX5_9EURY|nr:DUF2341 domain-containing protein [Thermococcus waiotapuensis]MDV3103936.1 DUF2341 domain-containing protein [Thermococcus waiotapuensis]
MKRRGFFLNSAAIILLIPLLLLLATYEDVSSQIITAQSERSQIERTYDVVSFLNSEFQKALEISGKRAVVAAVDYVATTGNFINPSYKANKTIADLMLNGNSESITNYDPGRIMQDQTLRVWFSNLGSLLLKQGYDLSGDISKADITVAPLDAFTLVIKARIPQVTVKDLSGKVVYSGPIPSSGGYIYSTVDLRDLEDPMFSAFTGGRYQRSIKACPMSYPQLGQLPISYANGSGVSSMGYIVGNFRRTPAYPSDLEYLGYNETHVWDQNGNYLTNFTINGIQAKTTDFIGFDGDLGVLVFPGIQDGSGSGGAGSNWCSPLEYRINLTIQNQAGIDLNDYQIPILVGTEKGFTVQILDIIFQNTSNTYSNTRDKYRTNASIAIYDSNCNPVPFWIEYWDPANKKALIWIRDTVPRDNQKTYSLYFGSGTPTKGNGNDVFIFFDDFEDGVWSDKWVQVDEAPTENGGYLYINGGRDSVAVRSKNEINYDGSFAIRFRMAPSNNNKDWDSGVGFQDSTSGRLWPMYFTDDVKDRNEGLVIHEGEWWQRTTANSKRTGTDFHLYEARLRDSGSWYDQNTKRYSANFVDITDGRANYDSSYNNQRLLDPPALKYLYIVNDNDGSGNQGIYDYILVRKYPSSGDALNDPNFNGITLYWRTTDLSRVIERRPSSSPPGQAQNSLGKAYDIQTFVDCLIDQRYIATESGWSFFERLEGSNGNHNSYVNLAHSIQDEMKYKYGDKYYPIGLVSFMIPHALYDGKLLNLMKTLGLASTNVSSADYYFLTYYFKRGPKVEGYRVWGISQGVLSTGDLSNVPFFIDPGTAKEVLGTIGACDLLYGYRCS